MTPYRVNRPISPFLDRLFSPVNILPLVWLRVAFGAIMLWEVWRYFDHGWIHRYYIEPTFFFTYYGFDWVRPLPGDGMYTLFYGLGLLAFCIMIGAAYRIVMPLFFLGFTYVFLLDQTNYLNHFYLISLISFLMIFIPANRALSVDARLKPHPRPLPIAMRRGESAPAWTLYLMRFQIGIAYIYGGIAKLNGDWLRGEPMRLWLANETDFPLIGQYFTQEWMVYAFSYGGLLLDLLAVPMLFHKWLRWPALAALILFHLTNAHLFSIGIFPWFMIATLPLFFPLRWWDRITERNQIASEIGRDISRPYTPQTLTLSLLALYCAFQLLFPLRHFLYPGNVSWTEQGHNFSWHMKLRDKESVAFFDITDPVTEEQWRVTPAFYLTRRQTDKVSGVPDMILQFSHFLAEKWRTERGVENPIVNAYVLVSLNGRDNQFIVDPEVNMAEQPRNLLAADWILPLEQPLKSGGAAQEGGEWED